MNLRPSKALSVAAALTLFIAAGCTDPTVAPKSTVTGANIWADQASYASYMAKLYGGLILTGQQGPAGNADISGIDEGFSEYLRLYWYMQEVPSDEAVIGWGDPGLPALNNHSWDATNSMVVAMYYRVYFQIVLANEFLRQTTLDQLNARGVGTTLKTTIQQYRAEARFLRALAYAHGMDFFGAIPLTTEDNTIGSIPAQVSRDSIYNYVVSELTAIRDSLPPVAGNYGRATPAAANMLLAEVYLNAGVYTGTTHYDLALNAAAAAIGGGYTLAPVFRNNFTSDNNLSPEIIFSAVEDGTHTQTWGGMTFLVHAGCGGSMSASTYGMDYCWGGYRIKQQAYRLFGAGDSRGSFFWTTGQTDSVISIGSFNSGIAAPKFTNKTSTGGNGSQQTMIDTDFPIFRLAEAYLIYAEANLRGGGGSPATALGYMNALRERAYGDATHDWASMSAITLDTILAERGRELLFEAKRRTDLIRFGKFSGGSYLWAWKGNAPGGVSIAATFDLYPLPANELAANPTLVQNPGY
jgi:starch-binding outer membrane protein, SusD/RagB family